MHFFALFSLLSAMSGWMEQEIERTLSHYEHQLSRPFLDQLSAQHDYLRVEQRNGELFFIYAKPHTAISDWQSIFSRLHALNRLPPADFDILVAPDDYLPCPACSELTLSNGVTLYRQTDEMEVEHLPIFVQADCVHYGHILMPDFLHLRTCVEMGPIQEEAKKISWEEKIPILFFRGSDSGITVRQWWPTAPRPYLIALSLQYPELIDARFVSSLHHREWLDYAFARGMISGYVPFVDHCRYKYLLDIDGNCAANPRNQKLMATRSVIFKVMTPSTSWFYPAIRPYEHFIPIKDDFSDLFTQLEWAKVNDAECQKIAENAFELAETLFDQQTIDLYIYRLLETYAKKQAIYY